MERMQDHTREDAERARLEAQRETERPRSIPPTPDCSQINELGSFSRGYQSGGLLGAFANIDEEKKKCEAQARTQQGTATNEFWDRVSQLTRELERQARFDPGLPMKTCSYHKSTMASGNFDTAFVTACINVGLIK